MNALRHPIALVAVLLAVLSWSEQARADDQPPIVVRGDNNGGIATGVFDVGAVGSKNRVTNAAANKISCEYEPDTSNHSSGVPQWEHDAPHAGEEGAWFFRQCSDGSFTVLWVADADRVATAAAASPSQLALQAANYLPLPAPQVRHNPGLADGRPQTVVGVPTWFWVDTSTFSTLRQTTSAGGVSATVTAVPVATEWTTGSGDARSISCSGPGVPYDESMPASGQSTYCSTVYARSSAGQPRSGPSPNDRFFTGTVTTVWRVSWVGTGGARGTLPDLRRTSQFRLAVAEIQAVNR